MRIGLLVFLVGHRESQGVEGAAEGIDRACRRLVLGQRSDCEQDHYHRGIRVGLKSSNSSGTSRTSPSPSAGLLIPTLHPNSYTPKMSPTRIKEGLSMYA